MTGSTCAFVSINSSIAGSILRIPVGFWGGVWAYSEPSPNPAKRNHITSSRNFFISASILWNCISAAGDLYPGFPRWLPNWREYWRFIDLAASQTRGMDGYRHLGQSGWWSRG